MTDDVRDSGANGSGDQPTAGQTGATPPAWPQPFPVSAPAPAPWAAGPTAPVPAPPAPVVPPAPAAPAGVYPPGGYAATSYPTAGTPAPAPTAPKVKKAAPWAVGVPAPRPPLASPPPVAPPPAGAAPSYGVGYAAPPPVAPPPVAPPSPGPQRSGGRRGLLIALALVLVAGLAGGGTWFFLRKDSPAQSSDSTAFGAAPTSSADRSVGSSGVGGASVSSAPSSSAATTSAPATPTAMTEEQALTELQMLRSNSLSRLVTDGRWVAQVASKSVGITDPLQTAANGTHTFYAVDILAESEAATKLAPASSVLVLQSTDFGKRSHASDGQAYWITVVDEGFGSSDAVKSWCASAFPTLTAEQLADTCAARTLSPPHD